VEAPIFTPQDVVTAFCKQSNAVMTAISSLETDAAAHVVSREVGPAVVSHLFVTRPVETVLLLVSKNATMGTDLTTMVVETTVPSMLAGRVPASLAFASRMPCQAILPARKGFQVFASKGSLSSSALRGAPETFDWIATCYSSSINAEIQEAYSGIPFINTKVYRSSLFAISTTAHWAG